MHLNLHLLFGPGIMTGFTAPAPVLGLLLDNICSKAKTGIWGWILFYSRLRNLFCISGCALVLRLLSRYDVGLFRSFINLLSSPQICIQV